METTSQQLTDSLQKQIDKLHMQLHAQEKMASLGILSAGIAHEIQNPLNFVINFSKMSARLLDQLTELLAACDTKLNRADAEEMDDIATDLKENMLKIQQHGERANSIIQGILLQSRGRTGEALPTDVAQLVHEYVWMSYHAMRAGNKDFNISIHEDYQPSMPRVLTVPQDLSRAVLNVMNNACYTLKERTASEGPEYTPTISVKVSLHPHTPANPQQHDTTSHPEREDRSGVTFPSLLTIEIADNGMGMSTEVQEKIYDTFFTTKPAGQGTGLGMSITRQLITQNLSGQLLMKSAPRVGTTFTFIIPVNTVK